MAELVDDVLSRDPFRLVGTLLGHKYSVERFVAEGGFGAVYSGRDLWLDRRIAIKVLKPSLRGELDSWVKLVEKFQAEATVLARLRHPSVVAVYDSGVVATDDDPIGTAWMVLEWLEGETLRDHLVARRERGGRTPVETLRLLHPMLEAMADAHDAGIVHRDLKPSNVMLVTTRGELTPRVLDFGIAKLVHPEEQRSVPSGETATDSVQRAFTAASAAPEQLSGARTGPWTDVYSLALMITEVLTDRPPVVAQDVYSQYHATFGPTRPTPANLGFDVGAWEAVLARAVAVQPGDRPRDARALLCELEAALSRAAHGAGAGPLVVADPPPSGTAPNGFAATELVAAPKTHHRRARWILGTIAVTCAVPLLLLLSKQVPERATTKSPSAPPASAASPAWSQTVLRELPLGTEPSTVAFDHSGRRVFYATREGIWAARIDASGDSAGATQPVPIVSEMGAAPLRQEQRSASSIT